MQKKTIPKDVQEKYIELHTLAEQSKQAQERVEKIEQQHLELLQVIQDIEDMKDVPADTEILVPLHNGIFVKAKMEDASTLHVNVGQGTIVEKSHDEVNAVLLQQAAEIKKFQVELQASLQEMLARAQMLEKDLQSALK